MFGRVKDRHGLGLGRRIAFVAVAAIIGGSALAPAPAHALSLFDGNAFRLPGPSMFPQFAEMVQRYTNQYQSMTSACASSAPSGFCQYVASWAQMMRDAEGMAPGAQIELVNRHFNDFRYVSDPSNWQVEDYWATPLQFYDVDGDCEDYAIVKYYTLRGLGLPANIMRIVVVMDHNLGVQHAVLAINTANDVLILDNQISGVVSASRIAHYTPILSINELGAWRHR